MIIWLQNLSENVVNESLTKQSVRCVEKSNQLYFLYRSHRYSFGKFSTWGEYMKTTENESLSFVNDRFIVFSTYFDSFRLVPFHFDSVRLVPFRPISFRLISVRSAPFRSVSFQFVPHRSVSFRFGSIRFGSVRFLRWKNLFHYDYDNDFGALTLLHSRGLNIQQGKRLISAWLLSGNDFSQPYFL